MIDEIISKTQSYIDNKPKSSRKKIGQFFTSKETALFMANMFNFNLFGSSIKILDPGAGTGILTAAFVEVASQKKHIHDVDITCYENNPDVLPILKNTLLYLKNNAPINIRYRIITDDYILSQANAFEHHTDVSKYDAVIGNPPYVVYTKKDKVTKKAVSDLYSIKDYKTIECNNLYGFVMERSLSIISGEQRIGMIVPLSFTAAKNMLTLRNMFTESKHIYVSSYEIRPAKLFDGGKGADQRLNIFIAHKADNTIVKTTEVERWHSEHREILFKTLYYSDSISSERILRFSNKLEKDIFAKFMQNMPITKLFVNSTSRCAVHYRSAGLRYWIIFLNNGFGTESASNKSKFISEH